MADEDHSMQTQPGMQDPPTHPLNEANLAQFTQEAHAGPFQPQAPAQTTFQPQAPAQTTHAAPFQTHFQLPAAVAEHIQVQDQRIEDLRDTLQQLLVQTQTRSATVKFNKPDLYHGHNRTAAYSFIVQCENNFASIKFSSENLQVRWVASFLRGAAASWIEPHLSAKDDPLIDSWTTFRAAFLQAFGDPHRLESVASRLFKLRQTGSVADYSSEFFRLASDLKWDDKVLMARFKDGLKPDVRTFLFVNGTEFDSTRAMSDMATAIDSAMYQNARHATKDHGAVMNYQAAANRAKSSSQTASGPAPMDLDAQSTPKGPLTPQERQRRLQMGLCFYCAGNHILARCPIAKPRPARIQGTEEGSSGEGLAQTSQSGNST